jgi:hypothetical protein
MEATQQTPGTYEVARDVKNDDVKIQNFCDSAKMERINTCITKPFCGQSLGSIVNPTLKDFAQTQVLEAVTEYPIEALMTGNVRSAENTALDILESYLSEQTESMVKYSQRPDANQDYLKKQLTRIATAEQAVESLRKSKTEVWLYLYQCIKAAERQFCLFGYVTINFPLRYDVQGTCYIDFINGRAQVWKR